MALGAPLTGVHVVNEGIFAMVRTLARVSAMVALVLPMAFVAAEPASATSVQTCAHVNGTVTFSPGITNTPTNNTASAKGTEATCTPSASTGGTGALNAVIKVPGASCAKLAQGAQTIYGVATSHWKNGQVTHYNVAFKTGTGSNATLANVTGKVTSGLFVGKHLTGQIRFRVTGSPTPNCTTSPVKTAAFANTKAFVIA